VLKERLIAYASEQPTRAERARVIAQMKRTLVSYLFAADQVVIAADERTGSTILSVCRQLGR